MMHGFDKLAKDISMGAFFLVVEAPVGRAFSQAFWEGKTYRPSQVAFDTAMKYGLIKFVGLDTYQFTPHGLAFRSFVTNAKQEERQLKYA
jgi:hypothetical protein